MPEDTPKEIKLKVNEVTTIKLAGLSTAGYEWSFIENNKDCITVSKDFQTPAKGQQKNYRSSADEIFTITAKKKGNVIVHFTQQRSWEKNTLPVNEKVVKIIVEEN